MQYENLKKARSICELIDSFDTRIKKIDSIINHSQTRYYFELKIKIENGRDVLDMPMNAGKEFMMYVLKTEKNCLKSELLELHAKLSAL